MHERSCLCLEPSIVLVSQPATLRRLRMLVDLAHHVPVQESRSGKVSLGCYSRCRYKMQLEKGRLPCLCEPLVPIHQAQWDVAHRPGPWHFAELLHALLAMSCVYGAPSAILWIVSSARGRKRVSSVAHSCFVDGSFTWGAFPARSCDAATS
jgi:hypothetical protein